MNKTLITLAKKIISIPSYVDSKNNESQLGKYLYTYLKSNFKWLKIYKQKVENDRFNLIATNSSSPQIVFISHLDTVRPSGNKKERLKPRIKKNKLLGLGAADMKGGLAATLCALQEVGPKKGISIIFDCDEEYYFKGIKRVIREYKYKPKLVLCPEPTNLEIVNGCRGVIEITFDIRGKTAHAGTPQNGVNAIEKAVELIKKLRQEITRDDKSELGETTVNLSALNGAQLQDGKIKIQANAVADVAKVLLDIRPASLRINAKETLTLIKSLAKGLKVSVQNEETRLDYKPYLTEKKSIKLLEKAIRKSKNRVKYRQSLGKGGFYEAALIANEWKCPAVSFGPIGEGHIPDESVEVDSLMKTAKVFKDLIDLT